MQEAQHTTDQDYVVLCVAEGAADKLKALRTLALEDSLNPRLSPPKRRRCTPAGPGFSTRHFGSKIIKGVRWHKNLHAWRATISIGTSQPRSDTTAGLTPCGTCASLSDKAVTWVCYDREPSGLPQSVAALCITSCRPIVSMKRFLRNLSSSVHGFLCRWRDTPSGRL